MRSEYGCTIVLYDPHSLRHGFVWYYVVFLEVARMVCERRNAKVNVAAKSRDFLTIQKTSARKLRKNNHDIYVAVLIGLSISVRPVQICTRYLKTVLFKFVDVPLNDLYCFSCFLSNSMSPRFH